MEGKYVFVCVPTGFGKTMCYAVLPEIFFSLFCLTATIIVISPLIALMKDQVNGCIANGIAACLVAEGQDDPTVKEDAKLAKYQVSLLSKLRSSPHR